MIPPTPIVSIPPSAARPPIVAAAPPRPPRLLGGYRRRKCTVTGEVERRRGGVRPAKGRRRTELSPPRCHRSPSGPTRWIAHRAVFRIGRFCRQCRLVHPQTSCRDRGVRIGRVGVRAAEREVEAQLPPCGSRIRGSSGAILGRGSAHIDCLRSWSAAQPIAAEAEAEDWPDGARPRTRPTRRGPRSAPDRQRPGRP